MSATEIEFWEDLAQGFMDNKGWDVPDALCVHFEGDERGQLGMFPEALHVVHFATTLPYDARGMLVASVFNREPADIRSIGVVYESYDLNAAEHPESIPAFEAARNGDVRSVADLPGVYETRTVVGVFADGRTYVSTQRRGIEGRESQVYEAGDDRACVYMAEYLRAFFKEDS